MNRSLIILFFSLFMWGIGEGLFLIFQPIYLQQLGAGTMVIASVFSAFGFAMMLAHIPAGYLADRIGRKPLLLAAWTCGLLATWVMALARTLPVFIVGMLLYGLTAFVSSPLNSYVTAARGRLTPERVMTLMSASFNLGSILGPSIGGWIGGTIGLRAVYFFAAGLFAISTFILFFIERQPRDGHDTAAPPASLFANTRLLALLGVVFVIMFTTYLPQPLTPKFLENERGFPLFAIGLLGSANGLGNVFFNLFLGQFSPRLGLVLVQACVAIFSLLIWRGTGLRSYMVGYFMLGGYRVARPFVFAAVRSLIHPSQMGLAYGVAETLNAMGAILAPLLAGVLYTGDPTRVYAVTLVLLLFSMLITVIFVPSRQKDACQHVP